MQKLLELTVDTTTVYLKGKERSDTVLTNQRSIALAFLECPNALGAL
jgi:hypothetical protein